MLHVWLMTCWKWWIFTFPAAYWNSTLDQSSNKFFAIQLYIFWLPGHQSITNRWKKKRKPKKSPIRVCSRWKKCAQLRTLGTPVQKPSDFLSIQHGHEHELRHGHGHGHGNGNWHGHQHILRNDNGHGHGHEYGHDNRHGHWHGHEHGNAHWHWHGHWHGYAWTQPRRTYPRPREQWHVQIYV